jgi:hypothetical protein
MAADFHPAVDSLLAVVTIIAAHRNKLVWPTGERLTKALSIFILFMYDTGA